MRLNFQRLVGLKLYSFVTQDCPPSTTYLVGYRSRAV